MWRASYIFQIFEDVIEVEQNIFCSSSDYIKRDLILIDRLGYMKMDIGFNTVICFQAW